jgi:hypothetical protein
MQAFNELRQAARDRRDKLIAKARDEYADTLRQIARLEQDLLGREPANPRSIASCVGSVIPRDPPTNFLPIDRDLRRAATANRMRMMRFGPMAGSVKNRLQNAQAPRHRTPQAS